MATIDPNNTVCGPVYSDPNSNTHINTTATTGQMLTQLDFNGPVGTGAKTGLTGIVRATTQNYDYSNGADTGPVSINITEYGPVGGYISGNFSTDRWYRANVSNSPFYSIHVLSG